MGHVVMTSELAGVAEHQVLCIEETTDPKRQAIFAFARKVSREPASITQEDVDSLRPYLKDAQIVELVFAVCRYNTMNRLADAFGAPLEKENVFAPPPKGKGGAGGTPKAAGAHAAKSARAIHAVVEDVAGDRVSIAAGSADGVRFGDVFRITRGAAEVGRAVIFAVEEKRARGLLDAQNPGPGAPPQPGDSATAAAD